MRLKAGPDFDLKLTSVPPVDHYNGVMILLREPNDPKERTEREYLKESFKWFQDVLIGEPLYGDYENTIYGKRSISRYGNRFREMLSSVDHGQPLGLEDIIYGNLSIYGGKDTIGDRYWEESKNADVRLKAIFDYLNNHGYVTKHAFVCCDLFQTISMQEEAVVYPEEGLLYSNNMRKDLIIWNDVRFYEILHPARSPRIITQDY